MILEINYALLDTSAIDYCCRNSISSQKLSESLFKIEHVPMISSQTSYELARTALNNILKARSYFTFINRLDPFIGLNKIELILEEIHHFFDNKILKNFLVKDEKLELIKAAHKALMLGQFTIFDLEKYVQPRQTNLNKVRAEIWKPISNLPRKKQPFRTYDEYLQLVKNSTDFSERIKLYLKLFYKQNTLNTLPDFDICKVMSNIKKFPAIQSLINIQVYLNFHIEKNKTIPSEDRFTDSDQIIEASYCSSIVSGDNNLLKIYLKPINSKIKPIKIEKLVENNRS